jgi:hypothetical protein
MSLSVNLEKVCAANTYAQVALDTLINALLPMAQLHSKPTKLAWLLRLAALRLVK